MDSETDDIQVTKPHAQKSNRKEKLGQERSGNFHKLEFPKMIEVQIPPIHYNVSPLKTWAEPCVPLKEINF